MGRGLSDLQKRILTIVYERRQRRDFAEEERRQKEMISDPGYRQMLLALHGTDTIAPYSISDYPDTDHAHVIAVLYDWPVYMWQRGRWLRPSEGGEAVSGGHNFRRSKIGQAEHNRRTASYHRAVGRLVRRGFLEKHRHGLSITDEGVHQAEGLSVSREEGSSLLTDRQRTCGRGPLSGLRLLRASISHPAPTPGDRRATNADR